MFFVSAAVNLQVVSEQRKDPFHGVAVSLFFLMGRCVCVCFFFCNMRNVRGVFFSFGDRKDRSKRIQHDRLCHSENDTVVISNVQFDDICIFEQTENVKIDYSQMKILFLPSSDNVGQAVNFLHKTGARPTCVVLDVLESGAESLFAFGKLVLKFHIGRGHITAAGLMALRRDYEVSFDTLRLVPPAKRSKTARKHLAGALHGLEVDVLEMDALGESDLGHLSPVGCNTLFLAKEHFCALEKWPSWVELSVRTNGATLTKNDAGEIDLAFYLFDDCSFFARAIRPDSISCCVLDANDFEKATGYFEMNDVVELTVVDSPWGVCSGELRRLAREYSGSIHKFVIVDRCTAVKTEICVSKDD